MLNKTQKEGNTCEDTKAKKKTGINYEEGAIAIVKNG
jgi:hypothetical protein